MTSLRKLPPWTSVSQQQHGPDVPEEYSHKHLKQFFDAGYYRSGNTTLYKELHPSVDASNLNDAVSERAAEYAAQAAVLKEQFIETAPEVKRPKLAGMLPKLSDRPTVVEPLVWKPSVEPIHPFSTTPPAAAWQPPARSQEGTISEDSQRMARLEALMKSNPVITDQPPVLQADRRPAAWQPSAQRFARLEETPLVTEDIQKKVRPVNEFDIGLTDWGQAFAPADTKKVLLPEPKIEDTLSNLQQIVQRKITAGLPEDAIKQALQMQFPDAVARRSASINHRMIP